jgi:ArsR family transcriptional regulator
MPTKSDHRLPAARAARLFALLANETRLRLLLLLLNAGDGGTAARDLAQALRMSQQAISHHLQGLRQARAVTRNCEGQKVVYALAPGIARDLLRRHVLP